MNDGSLLDVVDSHADTPLELLLSKHQLVLVILQVGLLLDQVLQLVDCVLHGDVDIKVGNV